MTTTEPTKLRELSGEALATMLATMQSSDSVELKVTLAPEQYRTAVSALGLDPLDAQIRQIFFFDTPDLLLNEHGLVTRARRVQGRGGDTVVKLRPVVPDELPEDVRRSGSMKVEVDAMPSAYVCSASMKGKAANDEILEAVEQKRPLRKLFTKEQRAFFTAHAPAIELDELSVLGPVFVLKETVTPDETGRRIVAELWLLPDGSRIVELSTKCPPAEAFQVAVESRAYLEGLGLDLSADPQTKTKAALEYFASH